MSRNNTQQQYFSASSAIPLASPALSNAPSPAPRFILPQSLASNPHHYQQHEQPHGQRQGLYTEEQVSAILFSQLQQQHAMEILQQQQYPQQYSQQYPQQHYSQQWYPQHYQQPPKQQSPLLLESAFGCATPTLPFTSCRSPSVSRPFAPHPVSTEMQQQSLTLRSLSPAPVLTRKRASESPAPLPATKKPRTITSKKNSNLNTIASDSNSRRPGSCNIIAIADDHINPPPSNQGPSNSGSSNTATNNKHNDDDNINNNNNIDLTEGNSSNSNGDESQSGDEDSDDHEDGDGERDEGEEDDDGFITLDDDGNKVTPDNMFDVVTEADKQKYLYGSWWDKDDIKVVLKWFFVPENAHRYRNPGKVAGHRLKDINLEIADLVNRALDELELAKADEDTEASKKSEKQKVYDDATVRDKYRQLKAAYDKCATELSKTGNGNKRSTLLIHVIKKITPYYKELFDIFGSQINGRNTVPSRESGVNGKKTFHLNIPDLDSLRERVNSSCDDKGKTKAKQNQPNSANQPFVIRDVEAILSKMETIYATNNGGPATSTAGANSIEQRWIDRERQLLEKERAALDGERQAFAMEKMEFSDSREKERRYMELQQMRLERDRQDIASREVDVREERAEMKAIKKERDIMFKRLALYEAQYGPSLSTSIATETGYTKLKNSSATGTQ